MNPNKQANDHDALENLISFALTRHRCYSVELHRLMEEEGVFTQVGQGAVRTFLNCCCSWAAVDPMGMVLLTLKLKSRANKSASKQSAVHQMAASLDSNPFISMIATVAMGQKKALPSSIRGVMEYFNVVRFIENLGAAVQFGFDFSNKQGQFIVRRGLYDIFTKLLKSYGDYAGLMRGHCLLVLAVNNYKYKNLTAALKRLKLAENEIVGCRKLEKARSWLLTKIAFLRFQIEPPVDPHNVIATTAELLSNLYPLKLTTEDIYMAMYLHESSAEAKSETDDLVGCIKDKEAIIYIVNHSDTATDPRLNSWIKMIGYYQIADLYTRLGLYSKALRHLDLALETFEVNGAFVEIQSEFSMTLKYELLLQKNLLLGDNNEISRVLDDYQAAIEDVAQKHGFSESSIQIKKKWLNPQSLEKFFKNGSEALRELASDFYIFADNRSSPAQASGKAAFLAVYQALRLNQGMGDSNSETDSAIRRLFDSVDWNQPKKLIMRMLFAGISWVDELGEGVNSEQWQALREHIENIPRFGISEKKSALALMEIRRAIGLHASGLNAESSLMRAISDAAEFVENSESHIGLEVFDILELIATHLKNHSLSSLHSAPEIVAGIETILWKLESIRQPHLDMEDRATIDLRMKRIYLDLASSYSAGISAGTQNGLLERTLAGFISTYADRASSRFFTSYIRSDKLGEALEKRLIPACVVEKYLLAEIELLDAQSHVDDMSGGEGEQANFTAVHVAKKRCIERLSNLLGKELPSRNNDRPHTDSEIKKRFFQAIEEVRRHLPDFEQEKFGYSQFLLGNTEIFGTMRCKLHLFMLDSKLHSVVHGADECRCSILSTEKTRLVLKGLYRLSKNVSTSPARRKRSEHSTEVSEWLSEVGKLLTCDQDGKSGRELEICVSSELSGIPFQAISLAPDSGLLGEECDVVYNSSMGLGLASRRRSRAKGGVTVACTVTDPGDLPCAIAEGAVVWGSRLQVNRLAGGAASFAAIQSTVMDSAIFHFCGHTEGLGSSRSLPTADGENITIEYCLKHPFTKQGALVILSACESGMVTGGTATVDPVAQQPRISSSPRFESFLASDTLGLASAFIVGGARSVISTLWTVEDSSSALFMWKLTELLEETTGDWNLPAIVARCAKWLREIPSGRILRDEILPCFLLAVGGSDSIGEIAYKECVSRFSRIYESSMDAPPYEDSYYWGPYVVIGCPTW